MMIFMPRSELEAWGPPKGYELIATVFMFPVLIAQIVVFRHRLIRAFDGAPLMVTGLLDLYVKRSDGYWQFFASVGMYVVLIVAIIFLLWGCSLQVQRWLYWRKRI
ncbi:hypothetical protein EH31_00480 [Erythrobacter longus]|uniref:Uncharacterized protein n=1 Tax=Erythrobacter longus TaxID=1044 RepID=A0A074MH44_ERYLO|nr:hypothetical protein EH31_00480 [Erythrobacter longus]